MHIQAPVQWVCDSLVGYKRGLSSLFLLSTKVCSFHVPRDHDVLIGTEE